MRRNNETKHIDRITLILYALLIFFGWMNIYAANYNPNNETFFSFNHEYMKQIIWIILSIFLIGIIFIADSKIFVSFSFILYGISVFLLFIVSFVGKDVNGARSWFEFGPLRFQPAEPAKIATALALSTIVGVHGFSLKKYNNSISVAIILFLPIMCIMLQNDTGSALVFAAFILPLFREGLSPYFLIIGMAVGVTSVLTLIYPIIPVIAGIYLLACILLFFLVDKKYTLISLLYGISAFVIIFVGYYSATKSTNWLLFTIFSVFISTGYMFIKSFIKRFKNYLPILLILWTSIAIALSANYFVRNVLAEHQQKRIDVMLGNIDDPLGDGYNVNQSLIAIGSGGFLGKGFLKGTQTKYNFVPEQSTDFIFCTVGEEWGFIGTSFVIILFILLMIRIIYLAEQQHSVFSRFYGYSVVAIIFFHFTINIGMAIGLAPVIGIPLPFFSYGGSSLWGFTALLFIFLKLDTNRTQLIR